MQVITTSLLRLLVSMSGPPNKEEERVQLVCICASTGKISLAVESRRRVEEVFSGFGKVDRYSPWQLDR